MGRIGCFWWNEKRPPDDRRPAAPEWRSVSSSGDRYAYVLRMLPGYSNTYQLRDPFCYDAGFPDLMDHGWSASYLRCRQQDCLCFFACRPAACSPFLRRATMVAGRHTDGKANAPGCVGVGGSAGWRQCCCPEAAQIERQRQLLLPRPRSVRVRIRLIRALLTAGPSCH